MGVKFDEEPEEGAGEDGGEVEEEEFFCTEEGFEELAYEEDGEKVEEDVEDGGVEEGVGDKAP